jgi:hypothetical protein
MSSTAKGPAMLETFTALLFAHVLADFVFQSNWMVANKARPAGFAAHAAVVLATLLAAFGQAHPALFGLAALHMAIDLIKTRLPQGISAFLADQALHLASLAALACAFPGLWGTSPYAGLPALPALMVLLSGAVIATRGGSFAIGLLMAPFAAQIPAEHAPASLPGAGRLIGILERGLIFALVLFGQAGGVGLLIAAKSILRFGVVKDDRALSEYVIIGTLASVGWAILAAFATQMLLSALPPLGILPATP